MTVDLTVDTRPRVYVAGPMRGHPGNNLAEFARVAALLRERGYIVVTPGEALVHEHTLRGFMRVDLPLMLTCDGVATLDGFQKSEGATLEVYVAQVCGMWCRPYRELVEGEWEPSPEQVADAAYALRQSAPVWLGGDKGEIDVMARAALKAAKP